MMNYHFFLLKKKNSLIILHTQTYSVPKKDLNT